VTRKVARGQDNGRAKLSEDEAREVYWLARSGRFWQWQIAEAYGVSQSAVSLIRNCARWRWLLADEKEQGMSENDDLKAEIEKLKTRQGELEAQLAGARAAPIKPAPHQPVDYTTNATMGAGTMREFANTIPERLAADLRADLARGSPLTQSPAQLVKGEGRVEIVGRGSGWQTERKLESPAGIALADRLVDIQDQDRADLQRRLARGNVPSTRNWKLASTSFSPLRTF
jgi:hypothetical protein